MSAAVAWGTVMGPQQGPSSITPVQLCNSQSNGVLAKLLGGKMGVRTQTNHTELQVNCKTEAERRIQEKHQEGVKREG